MSPRRRIWVYAGLALAAGVGLATAVRPSAGPAPSKSKPSGPRGLTRSDRLLLVGDSLAVGLSHPLGQLAHDAQVAFLADGRISTRISQWAQNTWLPTALTFAPTLVLISLGTNDMLLADPTLEAPALAAILERVRGAGANALWVVPPTMPFADRGVRAMIAASGVTRFPSDALTIPRGPDRIHPTAAGYAGWAGAIWQFLATVPRA